MVAFKLLAEFEALFSGVVYLHRISTHGDRVAGYLYEDLFDLARSPKYVARVTDQTRVLNTKNRATGLAARRGDGTFGERVPSVPPRAITGLAVARASVATIEIGAEAKILAKAMIKQIDRVCSDMRNQAAEFRKYHASAICVGIVGINHAPRTTSYEGKAVWPTDGKTHKHPIQEAAAAEARINHGVASHFDEMVILRFKAENAAPFAFTWLDAARTNAEYSSALIRISREYERRF
jgi:hypothetical protein